MPEITLRSRLRGPEKSSCNQAQSWWPPKEKEQPEPTEWHRIWVIIENPTDDDPGAIEEAQYAVAGLEVLLADLDGRVFATRQLDPDDDPATVRANRFARNARGGRARLSFPIMELPNRGGVGPQPPR